MLEMLSKGQLSMVRDELLCTIIVLTYIDVDLPPVFQEVLPNVVTSTYVSSIHQLCSPNDNNVHGEAKQRWRSKNWFNFAFLMFSVLELAIDPSDDLLSTVSLMRCLVSVPAEHVRKSFDRNFCIGKEVTMAHCTMLCSRLTEKMVTKAINSRALALFRANENHPAIQQWLLGYGVDPHSYHVIEEHRMQYN
jgi:hypothetical protein